MGAAARHPKYLMEALSTSEWDDWKAFFHLHPFGDDQIITMMARLLAFYIDSHSGTESPPVDLEDLLPGISAEERWEQIESILRERLEEEDYERKEAARLAAMTQEERDAEAVREIERQHAARMGLKVSDPES